MMSIEPANPNVEAIRLSVQRSCREIVQLVDGPLATLDGEKLYLAPVAGEWSIMQNLAHIAEFMPYWAGEIEKLVAQPGRNFGRTMQDERRIQAIEQHGRDNLAQVKEALPHSYNRLEEVLGTLRDSDLELTGKHNKFGEKSLAWFIEDFVTQHLINHLEQMKLVLDSVQK
jgi:uncharacterized damage-inducible protein DinB